MTEWHERAGQAWASLTGSTRHRTPLRGVRIHEPRRVRVVPAWPLSQVLHAGVLLDAAGIEPGTYAPDVVWQSFRRYRRGDGFLDFPVIGERYYDDNAWIGLACGQRALCTSGETRATWLRRAQASLRFVSQGVRRNGGVLWVEGGDHLHACSTGSAGLLAAAVGRLEGHPRAMAARAREFIDGELLNDNGLVADNISPLGAVDHAEYTYNQGLAIQLRIEGGLLDSAAELAETVAREFVGDRFWGHIASFNAIYCRALLRLDAVRGEQRWEGFVSDYAERFWTHGRDERGLFSGAGRYDKGYVLDHAAITGVLAALALSESQRTTLL